MNEAIRFTYNKCHFHGTSNEKDARNRKTTYWHGSKSATAFPCPWPSVMCFFRYAQINLDHNTIQRFFFLRRLGQPELVALSSFTHNFTISKTCRFCPFLEISAWVL